MKCEEAIRFGRVVRQLRKEQGLTQEKLAELSDLDTTYISMIERAARIPTIRTLFALARALHVSASSLISATEEEIGSEKR